MTSFGYGRISRAAPTLGAAPLVAFASDSIVAGGISNTATETRNSNYGMQYWVPALTGQRVRSTQSLNFGVAGDTTAALLNRLAAVAGSAADVVVVAIGTNDVGQLSFAQSCANLAAIWQRLIGAGKIVIAVPPLPRSLSTVSSQQALYRLIRWIRSQQWQGNRNFHVVDASLDYGDPLSGTGAPKANLSYDGLHPKGLGGFYSARAVAALLRGLYPHQVGAPHASAIDVYDAVGNPTGNLLTNGLLDGTGGATATTQGVTCAGSFAANWSVVATSPYTAGTPLAGLTVTGSKTFAADGRPQQELTLSGSYTGDIGSIVGLRQAFAGFGSFAAGDVVEAACELELDASASQQPISGLQLAVMATFPASGGTVHAVKDGYAVTADNSPAEGYAATLLTPPLTLTQVPNLLHVSLYAIPRQGAQSLNATFRIRSMSLRKVV